MWELFALIVYSLQWLGVVLGVGAEAVLLVAHLAARHHHQPDWLENIPAVRTVQRLGLLVIIGSGAAAVLYQVFNDTSVLFIPTFGFKWMLIALCAAMFWLEGYRTSAWLEGFAGATWLALFVVHSVAPIFMWVDLAFFYAIWLGLFMGLWGLAVWVMGAPVRRAEYEEDERPQYVPPPVHTRAPARPKVKPVVRSAPKPVAPPAPPVLVQMPKPVVKATPMPPPVVVAPPPTPKPIAPPPPPAPKPIAVAPAPIHAPVPHVEVSQPEVHEAPHVSLWQRLMAWLGSGHHEDAPVAVPAPAAAAPIIPSELPPMARASAPIKIQPTTIPSTPVVAQKANPAPVPPAPKVAPQPAILSKNLPVVEYLELAAPLAAPGPAPQPVAQPAPAPQGYVPDYSNIPGVRVMPRSPDELARESRAPIVQPA